MTEPEPHSGLDSASLALERALSAGPPPIPKPPPATLLQTCPALTNHGWLPETDFDDLEALRAEHQRLLEARGEAGSAVWDLERQFEDEDKARHDALKDAYRDGADLSDVAAVTPPEERKAALDAERERLSAAQEALQEFLSEALDRIDAGARGWLGELDAEEAEAQRLREEAERLLAQARALSDGHRKLRFWILRQAGLHPDPLFRLWEARCFPYAQLPEITDPDADRYLDTRELRGVHGGI